MKKDDSYGKNFIGLDSSGKNQSVTDMVTNYNIQYRMFLNFDQITQTENNLKTYNNKKDKNSGRSNNKNSSTQRSLSNLFKLNQKLSGNYSASQTLGTFGNLKTHSTLPTIHKTSSGFNNKNPYLTTHGKSSSGGNSVFNRTKKTTNFDDMDFVPMETYKNLVKDTMENYRNESLPMDINEKENEYLNNQKNQNNYFNNNNRTLFGKTMNLNVTYGENSITKVDIKDKDYNNPRDAIKILKSNKNIYTNINTSLINIQKMYYDRTITGIEKFHEFKNNMCKVRVSSMAPKSNAVGNAFKKGENASNKSRSKSNKDKNMEEEKKEESNKGSVGDVNSVDLMLEKEKEKEREKGKEKEKQKEKDKKKSKKKKEEIRFKNKIIRPGEMELYASYKTGLKNFPEGREQFAFDYNISDIILFGGIVTNKNNNVWVLDPCKN